IGYTKDMIERIIAYVDSYHYLDDARYLDAYLSYHKSNKSIRQLKMELQKKGLDSALIAEALEQDAWSDYTAIQKAIAKKTNQIENLSYEEKKKIAAYLFRKGFTESDIRKHLLL
ncbi:MAG: regulatory protein, partial [Clostridiales bacterium]|nr:regulatory protein [Clostridiales bacterium]